MVRVPFLCCFALCIPSNRSAHGQARACRWLSAAKRQARAKPTHRRTRRLSFSLSSTFLWCPTPLPSTVSAPTASPSAAASKARDRALNSELFATTRPDEEWPAYSVPGSSIIQYRYCSERAPLHLEEKLPRSASNNHPNGRAGASLFRIQSPQQHDFLTCERGVCVVSPKTGAVIQDSTVPTTECAYCTVRSADTFHHDD